MDFRKLVEQKAKQLFPDDEKAQRYFTAIAQQESNFNPTAHNTKNEDSYGLFQFGPDLRNTYGVDTNGDANAQLDAAGKYISSLAKKHNGDWTQILAEYNLGEPRRLRMMRGEHDVATERFWKNYLPAVTRLAEASAPDATQATQASQAPDVSRVGAVSPPGPQPDTVTAPAFDPSSVLPRRPAQQVDARSNLLLSLLAATNPQLSPLLQLLAMRKKSGAA